MRRKDREMSIEFGLAVIDQASYGVVSMIDAEGHPYGIPLSIVRDGPTLCFHSAKEGKKVEIFEKNPQVSVAFIGAVNVPEHYTDAELDAIALDESRLALLTSKVFTTEYESAVVIGIVKLVEDAATKINAMRLICGKFTPTKMPYFEMAIASGLDHTNVYQIEIQEIRAKRKKYDQHGEEMKWGRMD